MDNNRQFHNTSRVSIHIPSFHRLVSNVGKEYTVYKIVIAKPGGDKVIEKRYSEFYKLHKSLKESNKLSHGRTVEFPPRKLNPSTATIKEYRRGKLEAYMQVLSDEDPISTEVLAFLGISSTFIKPETKEINNASSCEDLVDLIPNQSTHQPIMGFLKDPFVNMQPENSVGDVLLEGILDGLYGDCTTGPFYGVC